MRLELLLKRMEVGFANFHTTRSVFFTGASRYLRNDKQKGLPIRKTCFMDGYLSTLVHTVGRATCMWRPRYNIMSTTAGHKSREKTKKTKTGATVSRGSCNVHCEYFTRGAESRHIGVLQRQQQQVRRREGEKKNKYEELSVRTPEARQELYE